LTTCRSCRAADGAASIAAIFLGGVTVLVGQGRMAPETEWSDRLYQPLSTRADKSIDVTLIPYYAWANRGISQMAVWLPMR